MATQIHTESATVYVIVIQAIDDTTDRLTLSDVAPGTAPGMNGLPMIPTGSMFNFAVARGTYQTGDQFTLTHTVSVA